MIKFRAWDKKTKEYFHISELWNSGTNPECFNFDGWTDNFGNKGRLKDIVIEQFTGLTDVYGEEIYEGDIVHGYDQKPDRDDGYIGSSVTDVVNFKHGAFWIGDSWYKVMVMTPPIVEVIGNIHENPELLEADK
ncbi:YopX family protein [Lactiplantibacillus plantarum]|uniref:YopX family protein n=1 Tax=Lactiplantibacillus plantarum TaxID=1590 RepID=UPI0021CB874A|nr:YopX family protein [Lactiplantibacillus plantarum]